MRAREPEQVVWQAALHVERTRADGQGQSGRTAAARPGLQLGEPSLIVHDFATPTARRQRSMVSKTVAAAEYSQLSA